MVDMLTKQINQGNKIYTWEPGNLFSHKEPEIFCLPGNQVYLENIWIRI